MAAGVSACAGVIGGDAENAALAGSSGIDNGPPNATGGSTSSPGGAGAPGGASAPGTGSAGSQGSPDAPGGPTGNTGGAPGGGPSASGGSGSSAGSPGNVSGGGSTATSTNGLPCEVQTFLAAKCQSCHRTKPPGVLFSQTDFTHSAVSDPSKTVAQLALQRIQATGATRMPPTGLTAATPAEIAAFKAWADAGAPATACGAPPMGGGTAGSGNGTPGGSAGGPGLPGPDPYGTPVMCSSGTTWRSGEGATMRPGEACIKCHSQGEGPSFSFAGTVFPTAHEPNDCNGASSATGASVVITDKNGQVLTVKINSAGNFSLNRSGSFAFPFTAKVVAGGKERAMITPQSSGDCNTCHTQDGTTGAPGRIMLP